MWQRQRQRDGSACTHADTPRARQDVHGRFRTEGQADVVPRFNERFILSLGSCPNCVVVDDELNILPLSKHCKAIEPLPAPATEVCRRRCRRAR